MPLPPPRRPSPESSPEEPEHERRPTTLPPPRHGREAREDRLLPRPPEGMESRGNLILKVVGIILLMVGVAFWILWDADSSVNQPAEQDRIRQLARMNPLPKSATETMVIPPDQSPDGMLGLRFTAPELEVQFWLNISPGTQHVKPEFITGNVMRYAIPANPADPNSHYSEVRWRRNDNLVWIAVSPAPAQKLRQIR
jgi:hypothetical protein